MAHFGNGTFISARCTTTGADQANVFVVRGRAASIDRGKVAVRVIRAFDQRKYGGWRKNVDAATHVGLGIVESLSASIVWVVH